MNKTFIVVLIVILGFGLGFWVYESGSHKQSANNTDYKNISYEIEGKPVKLTNGLSDIEAVAPGSSIRTITRYFGNEARGDFNHDGKEDIAFLLTQESGGSGTFYYIVAALSSSTGFIGTNAILLGDRVAPQNTQYIDGALIANYAERKPGEPMTTSPSVGVSKYLKVENNRLIEITK